MLTQLTENLHKAYISIFRISKESIFDGAAQLRLQKPILLLLRHSPKLGFNKCLVISI
jgi:hypothetical protein